MCSLGITPESNILYGVHESDLYDPIVPEGYFSTWRRLTGTSGGLRAFNHFCPVITTAAEARLLGVEYVLVAAGRTGPTGSRFVTRLATANPFVGNLFEHPPPDEELFRIPGADPATLSVAPPTTATSTLYRPLTSGVPMTEVGSDPGRLRLVTGSPVAGTLRIHLTDVPGWRATIDGRPLALRHPSVFTLEARIPPGRHRIELRYWPRTFTVGLVLALVAALGLLGALGVDRLARRRRTRRGRPDGRGGPRASPSG